MKTIFAMLFTMICCVGCCIFPKNTDLVFVDYDVAERNGLIVTNFTDNPIVATIEYDYSNIPNFSSSNINVTLMHTLIPLDKWKVGDIYGYTTRQINLQRKLMALRTVENVPVVYLKPRPARIKENIPGRLKIYSFDDIGVYKIEYVESKK